MAGLSEKEINDIEQALGLRLPTEVREQYRVSNGLLGQTNCQLLYTYQESLDNDILHNNTIRSEEWFPESFKAVVLIGNDGCGNNVCYDWTTKEALLWNAADGEWVQERRATVTEIWSFIEVFYANVP